MADPPGAGHGEKVVVVQFLKSGQSGEVSLLRSLGAQIFRGKAGTKFSFQMNEEEKAETQNVQMENLRRALECEADPLVLDEACAAWHSGLVDQETLKKAVLEKPFAQELVLTGCQPPEWMLDATDYSTEMHCHRHPFERGIPAREGVEF